MNHLVYLNKFLWKYKYTLITGIVFITIANIFALYPAEFVRKAFDTVVTQIETNQNLEKTQMILLKYGGLIICFAILKGVFMYFMRQTIIVMSRKIEFDLKNEIYIKYQELSINFYKRNNTGDLMNRITEDVSRVRMYVGPALMYAINITILFSLVITKMISISPTLTSFVLSPLPILAISVYYVSSSINKRSEEVQRQLSKITTISQETFTGIKVIKSFFTEKDSLKIFLRNCKIYTTRQLQLVKIEALFFPLIIIMIGISTILTVYIGGLESFKGKISSGNIAEFIIYVNMLAWPVASIGWITSLVQRAAASQYRINEFLKEKTEIVNKNYLETPIEGNIDFKNVTLVYKDTGIKALKNINLNIEEGTRLGIFGRTGSGKSTIANMICRLYDPDKGYISIGDKRLKDLNINNLRKTIGYVPQDDYLFSGTIRDNIAFGVDYYDEKKIQQAAEKASIADEIKLFPKGLDTLIGERGIQLSGGQRQRLAIARTLHKNPQIYIFDDCMSAVDANKEKSILMQLKEETESRTTILISHRISSILDMDHIIVLDNGEIIESGTHEKLLSNRGFYFEMYKKQQKVNHSGN